MQSAANHQRISDLYDALERGAVNDLEGFFHPDIDFHIIRPQPVKTLSSRDDLFAYLAKAAEKAPEDAQIELLRIGADQDFVMCIHKEAGGTPREHRHAMVYRLSGDQIVEAWELTLGENMD